MRGARQTTAQDAWWYWGIIVIQLTENERIFIIGLP